MRMRKLVLDLSLAQKLPDKINKMLSLNSLGFIDVLSTVVSLFLEDYEHGEPEIFYFTHCKGSIIIKTDWIYEVA